MISQHWPHHISVYRPISRCFSQKSMIFISCYFLRYNGFLYLTLANMYLPSTIYIYRLSYYHRTSWWFYMDIHRWHNHLQKVDDTCIHRLYRWLYIDDLWFVDDVLVIFKADIYIYNIPLNTIHCIYIYDVLQKSIHVWYIIYTTTW